MDDKKQTDSAGMAERMRSLGFPEDVITGLTGVETAPVAPAYDEEPEQTAPEGDGEEKETPIEA